MNQRQDSHQKQFKPYGRSRKQSPSKGSTSREDGNYQDYINKTFDKQNTQNGADLKEAVALAERTPNGQGEIKHLQPSAIVVGAPNAYRRVAIEARPPTGTQAGADDEAAQGDVVDLDMDIDIESSQAISIQQPQIMEHEKIKMRKGGDLFFGGRRGEDDEVDERLIVHQQMSRSAYASASSNLAAYRANLGQAQLGQPMIGKQ